MKKVELKFLWFFLFACLLYSVNCQSVVSDINIPEKDEAFSDIPDKEGMTVKGIIKDDQGLPIANVVVADGFNFSTSDEKGIYYLPSDLRKSKFVTISVPSSYFISAETGIASGFYAKLTNDNTTNQCNFILRKRSVPQNTFTYIAISDPQVRNASDLNRWRSETVSDITEFVKQNSGKEMNGSPKGYKTRHLFKIIPTKGTKEVKVEVTNRFGEQFYQMISL